MILIAALALTVIGLSFALRVAYSGDGPPSSGDTPEQRACALFWPAWEDFARGLMTEEELRDAIKDVHQIARKSTDTDLRVGATTMLTAMTIGDLDRYADAARGTGSTCMGLGYY